MTRKNQLDPLGAALRSLLPRIAAGEVRNVNAERLKPAYLARAVDVWTAPALPQFTIEQLRRVVRNARSEIKSRQIEKPQRPPHRPKVAKARINMVAGVHHALIQHGLTRDEADTALAGFIGVTARTIQRDRKRFSRQKAKTK